MDFYRDDRKGNYVLFKIDFFMDSYFRAIILTVVEGLCLKPFIYCFVGN